MNKKEINNIYIKDKNENLLRDYRERDARHYSPAGKEWKNSTYSFNKTTSQEVVAKDKIAANSIRDYFNLTPKPNIIRKSKRMRDWLKRSSIRQLFTSKPEIKQTNDKAIVTIYTFDRYKRKILRKLFFIRKLLYDALLLPVSTVSRKNIAITLFRKFNNKYKLRIYNRIRNRHIVKYFYKLARKRKLTMKRLRKFNIKSGLYKQILLSFLRRKELLKGVYIYQTWKILLHHFKYKLKIFVEPVAFNLYSVYFTIDKKESKKQKRIRHKWNKEHEKKLPRVTKWDSGPIYVIKNGTINSYIDLLNKLNKKMKQVVLARLSKERLTKQEKIGILNNSKKVSLRLALKKYFTREKLALRYISQLKFNVYKYYHYTPVLKSFLSKLYDKKVQLNIVNLKYIQLNSEMFIEAISIKLRDRVKSLSRVMRKSFILPKGYKINRSYVNSLKEKKHLKRNIYTLFGRYNVIKGNIINLVFNNMFKKSNSVKPNDGVINANAKTIIKTVLSSIKYKLITGARVEARGRLTKRYAAARAVFKLKHRGTLRNLEYLKNRENDLYSPGIHMVRGDERPSIQYNLIHSKRRIGAFGIKGWISYN